MWLWASVRIGLVLRTWYNWLGDDSLSFIMIQHSLAPSQRTFETRKKICDSRVCGGECYDDVKSKSQKQIELHNYAWDFIGAFSAHSQPQPQSNTHVRAFTTIAESSHRFIVIRLILLTFGWLPRRTGSRRKTKNFNVWSFGFDRRSSEWRQRSPNY